MNAAALDDVVKHAERRHLPRMETEGTATIQLSQSEYGDLMERTLRGDVVEVSRDGLRLETTEMIPGDTRVFLWINLSEPEQTFFLRGEVRWVSNESNGFFNIGVEIMKANATQHERWSEAMNRNIS